MELMVYSALNIKYVSAVTFNHPVLFANFSIAVVVMVLCMCSLVGMF
jgi:hypothetical protein